MGSVGVCGGCVCTRVLRNWIVWGRVCIVVAMIFSVRISLFMGIRIMQGGSCGVCGVCEAVCIEEIMRNQDMYVEGYEGALPIKKKMAEPGCQDTVKLPVH